MEHRILLGGLQHLPFARSRIRALQATGLPYASERLLLPDGIVTVRIIPGHEFIRLEGSPVHMYAVGIEGNRVTVRTKTHDGYGDWRVHSAFADAYSDPLDLVPAVRLSASRCLALSPRSLNLPGSDGSSTQYKFSDGFGKGKPIYEGPQAPYLAGSFWTQTAWVISTDGVQVAGAYLFSAVDLTGAGGADARNIVWKCEHIDFNTAVLTAKPAMWAFTYNPATHAGRALHTLMSDNVTYIGGGKFVYALGGSSYNGFTPRDADSKMVIILTQDFETFTAYDVVTGLGGVYGSDDYALSSCCYIGNGKVMVTGYDTLDVIVFNSADGSMVRRSVASDFGYSTTRPAIMPLGDDSAAYWRYTPSGTAFNTYADFTFTTDAGVTWTSKTLTCVDRNGDPVTIDYCVGTTSVRKPVVKSGATITSSGEIAAIFHVPGVGHTEFRTTDLGTTWRAFGLVSATPATSDVGLLFRHVLIGSPGLSLNWG